MGIIGLVTCMRKVELKRLRDLFVRRCGTTCCGERRFRQDHCRQGQIVCEASRTGTIRRVFPQRGRAQPNAKTRRPTTRFLCNHIWVGFHVFCHRRHAKQPHLFFAEIRFVCLFFSQPHRGNVEIRRHVPEFKDSLRPEQASSLEKLEEGRPRDRRKTEKSLLLCGEKILDEEFVLGVSLQIFVQSRPEVQEHLKLLNHKRARARAFRVLPT